MGGPPPPAGRPPGHRRPGGLHPRRGGGTAPLIRPALSPEDALKYDPTWPLTDGETHGTEMAGVALYGDELSHLLQDVGPVQLRHRLESVKILPPPPRENDPRLYGAITAQ